MKRELTIDITSGKNQEPAVDFIIKVRVPVQGEDPDEDGTFSVSIDHTLEKIRKSMRDGTAAKIDEDQLVIFRLLQAAGVEYWPIRPEDL